MTGFFITFGSCTEPIEKKPEKASPRQRMGIARRLWYGNSRADRLPKYRKWPLPAK